MSEDHNIIGVIDGLLAKTVGSELGKRILEVNLIKPKLDGYMPGKVMSLGELKLLENGSVIHIRYTDANGEELTCDFHTLHKDEDVIEWSASGWYPFPVKDMSNETLLDHIDNNGYTFTIREAMQSERGEYDKLRNDTRTATHIITDMQTLIDEKRTCTDKIRMKSLLKELKLLEKQLSKIMKF